MLSFKLIFGLTDRKEEISDKVTYTTIGQKKAGKMNFCFLWKRMMTQQMRAREMNP
ncbi:unnamed protein product [marine sediment metagenome]|uniref:Uncharacterized protein n=1 Tax=marine sediment metagenome TaxID=412755 RepID=X1HIW5_9ZZZZ